MCQFLLVHVHYIIFHLVCTQVYCLPTNYENNVVNIVRILLLSMSLHRDSIIVSSVVSVSGPYAELDKRVLVLVFIQRCIVYQQLWEFVVKHCEML